MSVITTRFNKFLNHTCDSGNNNLYFEIATIIRINALVQSGRSYITLSELYENSGAVTGAQKTGVRYGVKEAKETGIIISTERRGVYEVR
jgi:hypothetical protein